MNPSQKPKLNVDNELTMAKNNYQIWLTIISRQKIF